ncbi:uncharacterized protein LOC123262424 [Cotesia glomerata]|nr:uncharacterized protein LOC123262424 [Cotesia glomerata]XP_044580557.1 uncharacterized protein LOC123262424 [Cotesia glomerata]XP_044580558.1 uncharacterized protein LOC123262424 [Cotesia glomerata]XP_044580560.1 uncharacterized protein LOC123262424 [Cotesia glomerata]
MTTLQEVSAQLMKPAKDLADWQFPLSKVLESYYTLLDQQNNLNFGEAALVLQNSANVYVRRVEALYQETTALQQSFLDHEHEVESEKATAKSIRRSRKTQVDFKNFDLLNLSSETLKNSTQKSMSSKSQKIKLINQRYPQLEDITRKAFTDEIIDINGEAIGKKYDFRCNQQLSTSRMLIDAITPLDFTNSILQFDINLSDDHSPENPEAGDLITENTETDANTDNVETDFNFENFDSCSDYETHANGMLSPTIESAYGSTTSNSNPNTPSSRINSDFSVPISDSSRRDSTDERLLSSDTDAPTECDTSNELIDESDNGAHDSLPLSFDSGHENQESVEKSLELESESNVNTSSVTVEPESNQSQVQNLCDSNQNPEKIPRTRDSIETDAGYTSGDPDDCQQLFLPIKRLRSSTDSVTDILETNDNNININTSILDPIPFESGVPDKLPRLRREFKLPCHAALLKGSKKPRKRKLTINERKKNQLKSFLTSDNESLNSKRLKKLVAENEEEIKLLVSQQKELVEETERVNYCPVMVNGELIGYESRLLDEDSNCDVGMGIENNGEFNADTIIDCRNKLFTSYSDGFYSSPRSLDDFSDLENTADFSVMGRIQEDDFETVGQGLVERIERKMKELRKEFDGKNEHEESAKWLETIEALKVAANRPSFHVGEYEKRILESLKMKETHQVEFHEIAENEEEPGNIARLFVASLHLANTYNVEINVNNINSEVNLTLLDSNISETS